jgi:hypothetical protein
MDRVFGSDNPIFRDRDDFTAGHSLSEQTLAALDASAALIVLGSPDAAKSHYVNLRRNREWVQHVFQSEPTSACCPQNPHEGSQNPAHIDSGRGSRV